MPPPSDLQAPVLVPDFEIKFVEGLVHGARFFCWLFVMTTTASCFSQPHGADMARAFLYLAILHTMLLPSVESDPQSHSKRELSLLSLGNQFDFYEVVFD